MTDIFADDTTLSVHRSSSKHVKESLTSDLITVNSWCYLNCMSINVAKTKLMIISCKQNANRIQNSLPSKELNNEKINYSFMKNCLELQ